MTVTIPAILALDFDGVICNGLVEYFETAFRTYSEFWSPQDLTPPADLAAKFYRLRPTIETGWEMPVLIRALLSGISEEKILQEWEAIAPAILRESGLTAINIATKLDQIRDEWIATDLLGWLSLHQFYPGVVEKLRSLINSNSLVQLAIVTTKEGRFVNQLLQQQGIQLPQKWIIGKESQRQKSQILRELINVSFDTFISLWFVEDRLKTLQAVQHQPDLHAIKLFLADWGYNTVTEREIARNHPQIQLLSLSQFVQDLSTWL